ncbi:MAG TPA: alkaline phosphatase D family protein [Burkholderiales bacterium]|nr:alkaline phosphatase D family protein [Burkholderiales bacterium]
MASLREPGLGPLVGDTTYNTCRVWIRADDPADKSVDLDENRRTVGVIGFVSANGKKITDAWYFRLQREFDRTGTFVLGKDVQLGFYAADYAARGLPVPAKPPKQAIPASLDPDTEYTVRCGTLTIDDPLPNAENLSDFDLVARLPNIDNIKHELLRFDASRCEATFRTFPGPDTIADDMAFLLGSCRYPGLLWKIKEADRIFGPMQIHFAAGNPYGTRARFTMMCGDQIYADLLNRVVPILRADTFAEFQQRYLTAYGAPNLRQLLRTSTTYMILDDHEIEDNWTQDRLHDDGKHQLFNVAIGAYQSYQWSHGPRTWGRLLYYTFECAGYPVFVLDTRTQRFKDDLVGLADNHLLGRPSLDPANHPGQLHRLLAWLSEQQQKRGNVPKFIVTSSVFVPNDMSERIAPVPDPAGAAPPAHDEVEDPLDQLYGAAWNAKRRDNSDSWPAFPNTRLALLRHIVANGIQNVVFLAGDIHCSNTANIVFQGETAKDKHGKALKAFSVTSSAFYWPFPFADGDPNNYVHDSTRPEQFDPFPIVPDPQSPPPAGGEERYPVMHYRSFGFTQEDNFTRLDLDRKAATLTVRVFNRDGELLEVDDPTGAKAVRNVLRLEAW